MRCSLSIFEIVSVFGILLCLINGLTCDGEIVYLRNRGILLGEVQPVGNNKIVHFASIRYGVAKRFEKAVEDTSRWNSLRRNPYSPGAICPQTHLNGTFPKWPWSGRTVAMSEDCLLMNVWAPMNYRYTRTKLPVLVFIHGGAYILGSIYQPEFDARILAARTNSIVVTFNYRLGFLGFGSFDTDSESVQNLGLHDILLGLKWINENIHSFGGNRDQVTIMGNSAGAMSIGSMMISPAVKRKQYFQRAIMASGSPNTIFAVESPERGLAKTHQLAAKFGCDNEHILACLKNVPFEAILREQAVMSSEFKFFLPVFGDSILPESPLSLLNNLVADEKNPNVDLLFGLTLNEGTTALELLPNLQPPNVIDFNTAAAYVHLISNVFGIKISPEKILQEYLPGVDQSDSWSMAQMLTSIYADININCPVLYFAERYHLTETSSTVYGYLLGQKTAVQYDTCEPDWGVCHTSEIPYIFGLPLRSTSSYKYSMGDEQLSADMMNAIGDFVHYGVIGKVSGTEWKQSFAGFGVETMLLKAGDYKMKKNQFIDRCQNFWYPILFS